MFVNVVILRKKKTHLVKVSCISTVLASDNAPFHTVIKCDGSFLKSHSIRTRLEKMTTNKKDSLFHSVVQATQLLKELVDGIPGDVALDSEGCFEPLQLVN